MTRILRECQAIAARRHGVVCDMGASPLHVCQPDARFWIEVEADQAISGTEQIRVTEYWSGSYRQHTTCCAWEAETLIEHLLDRSNQ